jgi:hypothetical protein
VEKGKISKGKAAIKVEVDLQILLDQQTRMAPQAILFGVLHN